MPDITMCQNYNCPKRSSCYRYMAKPNPFAQSYSLFIPTNTECDQFYQIKSGYKVEKSVKTVDSRLIRPKGARRSF